MRRFFAVATACVLLIGCGKAPPVEKEGPPTLNEALTTLQQHNQVITKALHAKNPADADEALHDAMYLADHLPDFETASEVDKAALEEHSEHLLNLLLQAHRGAHGDDEDAWNPKALADEISLCLDELETVLAEAQ